MKNAVKSEKDELLFSLYDKWVPLFEGELPDQPLANPFSERLYKLRLQEFFLGRVPHIGDFYMPRLHSYGDSLEMSTFTDLRNLQALLSKFKNNEYNAFTLFENDGQSMSAQFKLFYHDTPSLAHDVARGRNTSGRFIGMNYATIQQHCWSSWSSWTIKLLNLKMRKRREMKKKKKH